MRWLFLFLRFYDVGLDLSSSWRAQNLKHESERKQHQQKRKQHQHQQEQERRQHEQERKQHAAELQQFAQSLEEKQQAIARLEHRIKLLLQKVKGSRQERIDSDQLMLFSLEELQAMVDELEKQPGEEPLIETDPTFKGQRRRGRKGFPKNYLVKSTVTNLSQTSELVRAVATSVMKLESKSASSWR